MKLAVISSAEQGLSELISYGTSVGYDMVHVRTGLLHEISSSVHAVIYIMKDAVAETHEELTILTSNMQKWGVKRLVVYSPEQKIFNTFNEGLDWTVISEVYNIKQKITYDTEFAKFLIGQVTESRNLNSVIIRPATY